MGWCARMSNRWVIILGGSSELAIMTIKLLRHQMELSFFVHYRESSLAINQLQDLLGKRIVLCKADLEYEVQVTELTKTILDICEVPSIFIQFASPPLEVRRFKETTNESLQSAFTIQTLAAATVLRSLIPRIKNQQNVWTAQVIFISSEVVNGMPPKGMVEYVVGKYAMLGLMRALNAEFGRSTLRFHSLTPGMMDTKFLKNVPEIVLEAVRTRSGGKLETVISVANKLVTLIRNPDGLVGDAIYKR
jgi:3-oxoacyl-[acyl-carrier protein] reductase